jgi:hypothetical protein
MTDHIDDATNEQRWEQLNATAAAWFREMAELADRLGNAEGDVVLSAAEAHDLGEFLTLLERRAS